MARFAKAILFVFFLGISLGACGGGDSNRPLTEQEKQGERLFIQNCSACHATSPDLVIVGPSLAGLAERAGQRVAGQDARSYVEASILEPDDFINEDFADLMPKTFGQTLTGEEVESLVAYVLTLE